jgi:hypothetical protein
VREGSGKPGVPKHRDEDLQRTARPAGARPNDMHSSAHLLFIEVMLLLLPPGLPYEIVA